MLEPQFRPESPQKKENPATAYACETKDKLALDKIMRERKARGSEVGYKITIMKFRNE